MKMQTNRKLFWRLKKLDAKLERPSEFGEIMEDSEESAEVFQLRLAIFTFY